MGLWESVPATAKVLCIFALVLVSIRRKVQLGTAFTAGAVGLGAIFLMR